MVLFTAQNNVSVLQSKPENKNFLVPRAQMTQNARIWAVAVASKGKISCLHQIAWGASTITCFCYSNAYNIAFLGKFSPKNIAEMSLALSVLEYYFQHLSQTTMVCAM